MRHLNGHRAGLAALAIAALLGHASEVDAASKRPAGGSGQLALTFGADSYSVVAGASVTLTWDSSNARRCVASGAWSGRKELDGSYRSTALQSQSRFTLTCDSSTGNIERSVLIGVTPHTTPTLKLTTSASEVKIGESITLSWTGEAVSNCQASGSWTGARASSGSELRSSLSTSENYTLTCDSAAGKIVSMTAVQVSSSGTRLTWQPPTYNTDGTPITDLTAYRIHVGNISQSYYEQIELTDVSLTEYSLDLLPGEYTIAVTAVNVDGIESDKSNEVLMVVQ